MFSPPERRKILNKDASGPLRAALEHLTEAGVRIDILDNDASLRIVSPSGAKQLYAVEVRSRVSPSTAVTVRASAGGHRPMIVSTYIPESVADYWRQQDIHYVDSVGNMYVRLPGLTVDVRGRRKPPPQQPAEPGRPLRAFRSSGLRILFLLLSEPGMASVPLREIAHAAVVSLGTVQWVVKELEESGYLSSGSRGRELHRAGDLLDRWTGAYTLDLYPRLTLARFESADPIWWTKADEDLRAEHGQWGGETAAHLLGGRLRPGRAVIYAPSIPARLAGRYRLRKADGEGNVEVRHRFWEMPEQSPSLIVPTPLVYADLVASADPRQLEAAAQLREHDELLRRIDRS